MPLSMLFILLLCNDSFFDGGCRDDEPSSFATQLMSLVHEALDVELTQAERQKTPYGYRFTWRLQDCMPFVVQTGM